MIRTTARRFAMLLMLTLLASGARAASITYVLDQTDSDPRLADGVPWLQVTISDGLAGAIDFTVSLLPSLTEIAGENFGIKAFAFNSQGPAKIMLRSNFAGLPAGWTPGFGRSGGDFGAFDVLLSGAAVAPSLSFSIQGIAGDSISHYALLSHGIALEGHVFFAALVGGFIDQDPGTKTLTKAWFGGSDELNQTNPVPLPAGSWLLVTALGSVATALRRRSPA
jgi:hypothetical protein